MKPFDNEKVRQAIAMAIDKQRIVDNFYPAGSSVAEQFVPPALQPGFSEGVRRGTTTTRRLPRSCWPTPASPMASQTTLSYRNVVRGYLPTPDKVAQEIQAQLAEIGVTVKLEQMESDRLHRRHVRARKPSTCWAGALTTRTATNFYDYHFANDNNKQFGTLFPDLVDEIKRRLRWPTRLERQKHYDKVNELIKQHVPMIPVAHGGSGDGLQGQRRGRPCQPAGQRALRRHGQWHDQLVWMQNGEPAALWCADETDGETLRACEQIYEALLSYKVGGVEVQPGLAENWEANADLTEWTFHLRQGVKFRTAPRWTPTTWWPPM